MANFINFLLANFNLKKFFTCLLFIITIYFLANTPSVFAQQPVFHNSFTEEDGDAVKDADGVKEKNKLVVWKGDGTLHIVTWGYYVRKGETLEIKSGAIVKIASEFFYDGLGILHWKAGGVINFEDGSTFLVNKAIITDIRDDNEGGDTNQDGNSSTPNVGGTSCDGILLQFEVNGGLVNGYIKNSTLKYVAIHGSLPLIVDNKFLLFCELIYKNYSLMLDPLLVPVISRNLFEFTNNIGKLDFQGSAPIISGNTFRYSAGAKAPGFQSVPILIGPAALGDKKIVVPNSGTITISDNVFETGGGIQIYAYNIPAADEDNAFSLFKVLIRNNTFRGVALPGESVTIGRTCLLLDLRAHVEVINNKFSNYVTFLDWRAGSSSACGDIKINNNYFERGSILGKFAGYTLDKFWKNGIFINAENNYWGDPSGPWDYSDADGLLNSRGTGVILVDGWDYVPFIGGTIPPSKDEIHITADYILSPLPMLPGTTPTLNVKVDKYKLASADAGQITVLIRDAEGFILNQPGTVVNVSSQNTSVSVPGIQFKVPDLSPIVSVEAVLSPNGDLPETNSNLESFVVKLPTSNFSVVSVKGIPSWGLVPGTKYNVTITLNYTLVTSSPTLNGSFVFDILEFFIAKDKILNTYPQITLSLPPGTNKTAEKVISIEVPLIEQKNEAFDKRDLIIRITMKDDKGAKVSSVSQMRKIKDSANSIENVSMTPAIKMDDGRIEELGRDHFLPGEFAAFIVNFSVSIATVSENIKNWQVWIDPTEFQDKNYEPALTIYQLNPSAESLPTGFTQKRAVISLAKIPSGVKLLAQNIRLVERDLNWNFRTINEFSRGFNVYQPVESSQKVIPTGASQISFNPIPVILNFSSNQNKGTAFAEEYAGQYSSSSSKVEQNRLMKSTAAWYWKFIPLNKYWSVYDTLKESTFTATISFKYNPATDFPNVPGFNEDSLVIAGLNPLSGELEALPSTLSKSTQTISTPYTKFFDTWVIVSKATLPFTGIYSNENTIPEQFALKQNYPNPFNPRTTIHWELAEESKATIKVFDMLGREVATLVDEYKPAGRYETVFNAKDLASGIYFYRLQAGEFSSTKKIILMK